MVVLLNSKDQKSKIKIVEFPQRGNDILYFALCILIFSRIPTHEHLYQISRTFIKKKPCEGSYFLAFRLVVALEQSQNLFGA